MIFGTMTGAANPLNGGLPVKTWGTIQMSDEPLPPISSVTTDLNHNHSEGKHVRFLRDRTSSLQNLWRSPCRRISIFLSCGVYSANNRTKFEIGQTGVTVVTDENGELVKGHR